MNIDPNTAARFWAKVRKADGDGCWEWTGARDPNGYGRFWDGKTMALAHRVSLQLAGVDISGSKACHRCDNPPCVRPDHFFLGTQRDNMQDCSRKGRQRTPTGTANPNAKLTTEAVVELRRRYAAGENAADLARAFSISWISAKKIATGVTRRTG